MPVSRVVVRILTVGSGNFGRAVGCIFGEFLLKAPLLPGRTELEQLQKIFRLVGRPTEECWPDVVTLPGYTTLPKELTELPTQGTITTMFKTLSPNVSVCLFVMERLQQDAAMFELCVCVCDGACVCRAWTCWKAC